MTRGREIIMMILIIAGILIPRLSAIDVFTTVDESTWLMRSANFYYALGQREFQNTVYAYHPAVTTMWTGALALAIDFPAYRGLGQGYFEKEWKFSEFLQEHGYDPLQMLKTSRMITVGFNSCLLLVIYYLLRRLLGWFLAFVSVFLLSFEPFLLGHTRILAHEGMMSLLLLVSILAILNFLYRGYTWPFLITSGVSAALAVLTKSSATIIIPFVGLLFVLEGAGNIYNLRNERKPRCQKQTKRFLGLGTVWLFVFLITFVAIWPGMWVNPGKMLYEMYGNAFSYAFKGHNLEAQDTTDASADTVEPIQLARFKKRALDIPWRTTPVTWLGLGFFVTLMMLRKIKVPPNSRKIMFTLFGFGLLFYLMMSFANGRLAAHYIMVTFASWSLTAGIALAITVCIIREHLPYPLKFAIPVLITGGLLVLQSVFALNFAPYYLNFSNPILEAAKEGIQTPVTGFGEGLELAAAYLAKMPNAEELTVLSWWGIGPFSFYFPGQTENLYPIVAWTPGLISRLEKSDYLVIYYYHQIQRNMPAKLMQETRNLTPEHTIWIQGVEYIRIYKVSELPDTLLIPDVVEIP